MKIRRIDRLVVALYAVMGALALLVVLIWACAPESAAYMGRAFETIMSSRPALRVGLIALTVVLMALSGFIIWLMARGERKGDASSVAIQSDGGGAVRVSTAALEQMARQAIGQVDGVDKLTVALSGDENALSVSIGLTVYADTRVPAITQAMQANVRRALEEFAGVPVSEVVVLVSGIASRRQNDKAEKSS